MKVQFPIRTRQTERNQLAAHLTATVSYLWFKAMVSVVLGALLGTSMLAGTRANVARSASRAMRTPLRAASLQT